MTRTVFNLTLIIYVIKGYTDAGLFIRTFFMLGLAGAFYLISGRGAKSTVDTQFLSRQQLLARAQASNIVSFFKIFGDSVTVMAQLPSIKSRGEATVDAMDAFVKEWGSSGLVGGIALTDKNGIVQFNSNVLGTQDIGTSLADRQYFQWAQKQKEAGEYFIGVPVISRFGATKDQTVVPVASPVFQGGVFTGIILSSVKLNPLAERFTELMKVSDTAKVYLISQEGNLLHSNSSDQVLLDSIKSKLNFGEEGILQVGGSLIAYSPISLGDQDWILVMASPSKEVGNVVVPIYFRLVTLLAIVLVTIFVFGVVTVREVRSQKSL